VLLDDQITVAALDDLLGVGQLVAGGDQEAARIPAHLLVLVQRQADDLKALADGALADEAGPLAAVFQPLGNRLSFRAIRSRRSSVMT
jgi:hypothetical protein